MYSQYRIQQRFFVENTVDIPVPRSGGLQGSRPGQGSTASSSHVGATDNTKQKSFSHFSPGEKSAAFGPHSGSELSADFNPSTLSAHQMPGSHLRAPEQLVDVPVPQIAERASRRKLLEVLSGLSSSLEEEEVAEDEEEEEEEGSRFLPHFRPRRWCWYLHAGSICPRGWQCTFAQHESELHPDSW